MKLEVALAELKGVRVAIAFVAPDQAVAGAGDVLLDRLRPHFPTLPILLAALDAHGVRAYAPFQAGVLVAGCDLAALARRVIDLDLPPSRPEAAAPF